MSFLDEEDEYDINQYTHHYPHHQQQPYYCNDLNNTVNNTLNINGLSLSSPSPPPPLLSFHHNTISSFQNSSPCIGQHGFSKDTVDKLYSYLPNKDIDEIFLEKYSVCSENRRVYAKEYQELVDKYKNRYDELFYLLIKGNKASLKLKRVLSRAFYEIIRWYKDTDEDYPFSVIRYNAHDFNEQKPRLQWIPSHRSSSSDVSEDKYPYTGLIFDIYVKGHTFKDLSNFGTYVKLMDLELTNGALESLKGLDKLNNLKRLNVSHNRIYDISAITLMVNLRKINLYHNRITNGHDINVYGDGTKSLKEIFSTLRPSLATVKKYGIPIAASLTINLGHNFIANTRDMNTFVKEMQMEYGIEIEIPTEYVVSGVSKITTDRRVYRVNALNQRIIDDNILDAKEENADKIYYDTFEKEEKARNEKYNRSKQIVIEKQKKENEKKKRKEKELEEKEEESEEELELEEKKQKRNIGKEEVTDDE